METIDLETLAQRLFTHIPNESNGVRVTSTQVKLGLEALTEIVRLLDTHAPIEAEK